LAFSESLLKGTTAVGEKKDLIGKINIDLKIPVLASISASFVLNVFGYLIVLLILLISNKGLDIASIPLIFFPLLLLYIFAISLGLILSAVQVFVKDTLQFMTTVLTLWFFMTPIIYSESILPEKYKVIIRINPVYTPIEFIHNLFITKTRLPWVSMLVMFILLLILLSISIKIFDKLSPSFEEFK
jgi:ABC-type polysaccharide/polyol phosphate export permease